MGVYCLAVGQLLARTDYLAGRPLAQATVHSLYVLRFVYSGKLLVLLFSRAVCLFVCVAAGCLCMLLIRVSPSWAPHMYMSEPLLLESLVSCEVLSDQLSCRYLQCYSNGALHHR